MAYRRKLRLNAVGCITSNKIPLDQAALIEPLSVGHHAFVRSGARPVILHWLAVGPIGLLLSAILKAKGLKVIITELSAKRKEKPKSRVLQIIF